MISLTLNKAIVSLAQHHVIVGFALLYGGHECRVGGRVEEERHHSRVLLHAAHPGGQVGEGGWLELDGGLALKDCAVTVDSLEPGPQHIVKPPGNLVSTKKLSFSLLQLCLENFHVFHGLGEMSSSLFGSL